jgi:Cu(I)/Ag(I) efflux system membrane fusion protein
MKRRRLAVSIALAVLGAALLVVFRARIVAWFAPPAAPKTEAAAPADVDYYTCPMHPSVHEHAPGQCPICGMTLVPVTKQQLQEGIVTIDGARRQQIGVRTAPVAVAPMHRRVRAVGRVTYDESRLADVSLKVRGWITKLFANETGVHVTRGQPLFSLYSPELYNAEKDFLVAAPSGAADGGLRVAGLAQAARQRLRLLGVSDGQIDAVARRGSASDSVVFSAPVSGMLIEKNVVEGAAIEPGTRVMRIAALDRVWIEADVYESDLPTVREGQHATVTLDYVPGRTFDASVAYVYPYLDDKARTGRVRLELQNHDLDLKPGMYANVELAQDLGPKLQVPLGAVVYTGPRRLVFVDLGQGRFKPQVVTTGAESDGMVEVLTGLKAGDVVAVSGVFLVAAEARIATAAKYWESSP